jgi:hypothetical protein
MNQLLDLATEAYGGLATVASGQTLHEYMERNLRPDPVPDARELPASKARQ